MTPITEVSTVTPITEVKVPVTAITEVKVQWGIYTSVTDK